MSVQNITSYCLVEEKDIKTFNKNVCELIAYGYQPHGNIIISRELSGSIYSQVMVKHGGFGTAFQSTLGFGNTSSSGFGSSFFGSTPLGFGSTVQSTSSESSFGTTTILGSTRPFGFV